MLVGGICGLRKGDSGDGGGGAAACLQSGERDALGGLSELPMGGRGWGGEVGVTVYKVPP